MCRSQQSLRLLAKVMEEFGITQECCLSAQEAIELLARGHFAALVLDFDLPGAAQVAKLARLAPAHRRPVVFAMIGASMDIGCTYQAGANFVLYKPLEIGQVKHSLRAARGFLQQDRRRAPRQPVETVVYLLFGKNLAIPALMLDLSQEGLSVQAAEPLPAVDEVPIHFLLPGTNYPVEGTAEVIWADDSGRAGMFFSGLATTAERRLKNWLTRRNRQPVARAARSAKVGMGAAALQW